MSGHGSGARGRRVRLTLGLLVVGMLPMACARPPAGGEEPKPNRERVLPGLSVLLEDSLPLIAGRRIALITNHTGVDAEGVSGVELLQKDPRAVRARVQLVRLFSPEHGIRGTEDRSNLPDEFDARSGLMVHSLYGAGTQAPADSLLRDLDALVFDLQDIGTRTWTYVGVMVYAMRAAAKANIPFIVLDRPNPLGGRMEGALLDTALANPENPSPERRAQAFALYPVPLRHGMTMGEMGRYLAGELGIPGSLVVVPMKHWRRSLWWDETGLPWTTPSPAMTSLTSALLYPTLVPFEGSNVSVGRGTSLPFQRFGASWMDARRVATLLQDRGFAGVRFEAERFRPEAPGDNKFAGREIPGVRIVVEDRDRVQVGRVGAAILWALVQLHRDSLRLTERSFDLRFGSRAGREALMRGSDSDEVMDATLPGVVAFQQRSRRYWLYR